MRVTGGITGSSFALVLLLSLPAAASPASSLEKKYLATRDDYIRRFAKDANNASPSDERRALEELQELLRAIVGPVKITGLAGPGEINLETLLPDAGFGQVDGLNFRLGGDSLFVTTRGLLHDYVVKDKKLPKDLVALAQNDQFYGRVLSWDVAITLYAELPVTRPRSMAVAKAYVALSAQDIGPWPPNTLLVFAATGARVLVVTSSLEDQLDQLPECEMQWDESKEKYRQALSALRSPEAADKEAKAKPMRYQVEGFEASRRCYGRSLPGQPEFVELTRRAQAITDRLQGQKGKPAVVGPSTTKAAP